MNNHLRAFLLLAVLLGTRFGYLAAQPVVAADVIAQINAGTDVHLDGAVIEGDLDFTRLDNMRRTNTGGDRAAFRSTVKPNLNFTGCTFTGEVLGFVNNDNGWGKSSEPIYHADFNGNVTFTDCKFRRKVAFKYSNFEREADFRGSTFRRDANFKYTVFEENTDFAACRFGGEANFKYTDFEEAPSFAGTVFEQDATFKYTKLERGVDFSNTVFEDDADFKYVDLGRTVSYAGAEFRGNVDFKYVMFPAGTDLTNTRFGRWTNFKHTTLGGKKFSR